MVRPLDLAIRGHSSKPFVQRGGGHNEDVHFCRGKYAKRPKNAKYTMTRFCVSDVVHILIRDTIRTCVGGKGWGGVSTKRKKFNKADGSKKSASARMSLIYDL